MSIRLKLIPPNAAQFEYATRVALRDAEIMRTRIRTRLCELREQEQRGRALVRDASALLPSQFWLALADAMLDACAQP